MPVKKNSNKNISDSSSLNKGIKSKGDNYKSKGFKSSSSLSSFKPKSKDTKPVYSLKSKNEKPKNEKPKNEKPKKNSGTIVKGALTSKQRANLRALASKIEPIYQIGKDGVSDFLLDGIAAALNKRELIKITVLKNCPLAAADLLLELSQRLNAIPVSSIGFKVILYKRSTSDDINHIEF